MAADEQPANPGYTLMLRNIPCRHTQEHVKEILDSIGLRGMFDLIYAPRSVTRKSNVGYAFVNFRRQEYAQMCFALCDQRPFGDPTGEKLCQVMHAHIQGGVSALRAARWKGKKGRAEPLVVADADVDQGIGPGAPAAAAPPGGGMAMPPPPPPPAAAPYGLPPPGSWHEPAPPPLFSPLSGEVPDLWRNDVSGGHGAEHDLNDPGATGFRGVWRPRRVSRSHAGAASPQVPNFWRNCVSRGARGGARRGQRSRRDRVSGSLAPRSHAGAASSSTSEFRPPQVVPSIVQVGDEDNRTTIMLKHLPLDYDEDVMMQTLDEVGLAGTYDVVYLPRSMVRQTNLGYAFVNLTDSRYVKAFRDTFEGRPLGDSGSGKPCVVAYARIQGQDFRDLFIRQKLKVMGQEMSSAVHHLSKEPPARSPAATNGLSKELQKWGLPGGSDDVVGESEEPCVPVVVMRLSF